MNQSNRSVADNAATELLLEPKQPGTSIQNWLYQEIREAVLRGRLGPGERLPSTRRMAADWDIARGTVVAAYEQLAAEGYLESLQGSGYFVSPELPDQPVTPVPPAAPRDEAVGPYKAKPDAPRSPFPIAGDYAPQAFCPFQPDSDHFPRRLWGRLLSSVARHSDGAEFRFGEAAGSRPLRKEIAKYLSKARGVRCTASQVVIVSGTQHALEMVGRLLLANGDTAAVEDPAYGGALTAFDRPGVTRLALSVDDDGLDVERLESLDPAPRLVYVTPTNQCPLGMAMSLERRFRLLEWARKNGAYIFEDDYDGEFRYAGRPLPALQGLDGAQSVIYAGTFNKTMFASLRLGYLVLPPALVEDFLHIRSSSDRFPPGLEQAALARFLSDGYFTRHIRRMRKVYAARLELLRRKAAEYLPDLKIDNKATGLETIAWLPPWSDDVLVAERLNAAGVAAQPLSRFCVNRVLEPGLILGFASVPEPMIVEGVRKAAAALEENNGRLA